jgi:hypothetical protein
MGSIQRREKASEHKKLLMDKVPLKQCYRYVSTVAKEKLIENRGFLKKYSSSLNIYLYQAVLGIWLRIRMFLGLSDPYPLVRGMGPDPDPSLFS